MDNRKNSKGIGDLLLRLGMGWIFIAFGIGKFYYGAFWSTQLPDKISLWLNNNLQISPIIIQNFQAVFEIVIGVLLILGLFTTLAGFLGGLYLATIIVGFSLISGWSDILVYDTGLLFSILALLFLDHEYSLDHLINHLLRDSS